MRTVLSPIVALLTLLLLPLHALAQTAPIPPGPSAALVQVTRDGKLAAVLGLAVTIVTQLMRSSSFGGFVQTMPKRLRVLIPIGLSCVTALVTMWLSGTSWTDAIQNAVITAATSIFAAETVIASGLGQRTGDTSPKPANPTTPVVVVTEDPPPSPPTVMVVDDGKGPTS